MKKFYRFSVAVALLLIGVFSANAQDPDVYVGGIQNDQAAIWVNGTPELIDAGQICCIEIVGDDYYVAGLNMQGAPIVWKNEEELFTLPYDPSSYGTSVTSMAIHNDDVYLTTTELTQNGLVGTLWINEVASEDYSDATELNTVIFDGDDIYVAGGTNDAAVIWKNAEPIYTYTSSVTALFVDVQVVDGDVYYVGGDFGANGKYAAIENPENVNINQENNRFAVNVWKNDEVLYTLGSEVYGTKMVVSDGTVYVSGQVPGGSVFKAIVWVDGEPTILSDLWSGAQGLCLYNDELYVTGFVGSYPELDVFIWNDGEFTTLTSPGYDMGNCIAVEGETTDIEEVNDVCSIYPNPADDYILIEGVEFVEAVIYNSLGQKVMTANDNKIDVSSLDSGLYLLKLDNNITRSIVVKH